MNYVIFFVLPSLSLGCCQTTFFFLQIICESTDSITHEIVETMQQLIALHVSFPLSSILPHKANIPNKGLNKKVEEERGVGRIGEEA